MKQRRNTNARREILKIIQESKVALSQNAIQILHNGLCDRVTTYRVLDRLTEEGLLHKVVNINGVVNYASCTTCSHDTNSHAHERAQNHSHVHFSCKQCNQLTCLADTTPDFVLPDGFEEDERFFTVLGTCNKCRS